MAKKKLMVNLGCGIHAVKGFVNVDNYITEKQLKEHKGIFAAAIFDKGAKFIKADMKKLPFKNDSVDYVECLEAIEHIAMKEVPLVFREIYRILKPKHKACILTPDFAGLARLYLDNCNSEDFNTESYFTLFSYVYGNQIHEGEFHKSGFSPWYAKRLADTVGFSKTEVQMYPRGTRTSKGPASKTVGYKDILNGDGYVAYDSLFITLTK